MSRREFWSSKNSAPTCNAGTGKPGWQRRRSRTRLAYIRTAAGLRVQHSCAPRPSVHCVSWTMMYALRSRSGWGYPLCQWGCAAACSSGVVNLATGTPVAGCMHTAAKVSRGFAQPVVTIRWCVSGVTFCPRPGVLSLLNRETPRWVLRHAWTWSNIIARRVGQRLMTSLYIRPFVLVIIAYRNALRHLAMPRRQVEIIKVLNSINSVSRGRASSQSQWKLADVGMIPYPPPD